MRLCDVHAVLKGDFLLRWILLAFDLTSRELSSLMERSLVLSHLLNFAECRYRISNDQVRWRKAQREAN